MAENTPLSRWIAIRLIHAPLCSLASGKWWTDSTQRFRGYSADQRVGEEGTYTATVTIHHESAVDAVTSSTAIVTDPAVIPLGGFALATARVRALVHGDCC